MTTETRPIEQQRSRTNIVHHGGGEAVYGLGLIGAWVYFIGHAGTFSVAVLGFLKGIVWPALVVYEVLKYLNM